MLTTHHFGQVPCCLLAIFMVVSGHVSAYRKFGQDCRDLNCAGNERCIVSHVACEKDQRDGEHCGLYPRCVERPMSSDQHLIDTTSTTANSRSPTYRPITSTIQLNHQFNIKPHPDLDSGFELLTPDSVADPAATHADQRQANVLVIVQDGAQQPILNPNPNQNYNIQPWRQPCIFSPYYPYACNYQASPYVPSVSRSMPAYPNGRAAAVPQFVPPTPPCYYNCYPRLAGGYPFAGSVRPSTLTNNYLMYITI